ncbi:MAG: glycosyltransferase, partial [Bacteroidales bacterium]|nr:glycosyltransferase [Bacteroidales bacterium]
RVPDRDLRAIYAAASIFIYPSLYEGFGIPILEAMSCGVPTITTSDVCFREAGGAACRYITPNNSKQLSEEINILLTDSELRSECIARGRQQMSKFTEENIAAKLSEIYETIL